MGISALLCLAVLGIGLDVKIPLITKCGSRTLQVYFWHRTIVYMAFPERWELYLALTAIPIVLVLCIKIFGVPLDMVLKGIRGRNDIIKENGNEK